MELNDVSQLALERIIALVADWRRTRLVASRWLAATRPPPLRLRARAADAQLRSATSLLARCDEIELAHSDALGDAALADALRHCSALRTLTLRKLRSYRSICIDNCAR